MDELVVANWLVSGGPGGVHFEVKGKLSISMRTEPIGLGELLLISSSFW